MSTPRFSPGLFRVFSSYLDRYLGRHLNGVRVSKAGHMPSPSDDRPWVIYTNHPSWWDPLMFMVLAREFFPRWPGYGPMDADKLERYGFFRRLGAFPVERGTLRGAAQFLRAGQDILSRPQSTLWITAEGRFVDPRARPIRVLPGLGHLVRRSRRIIVVPLVLEYPFWSERNPEALARFGEPIEVEDGNERTAREWTERFRQRLASNLDALANDAVSREPGRFVPLLRGRAGTAFVYDLWRRAATRTRGRSFEAAHLDGR